MAQQIPSKTKAEEHLVVDDKLYKYILDHSLREHKQLKAIQQETVALGFMARMITAPDQAQWMGQLIRFGNVKNIIEVGVFTGYSSLAVALNLPEDGKIIACDISEEFTNVAKKHWKEAGVDHKIDLRVAPAVDTLDALLAEGKAGQFDFAFIDADKVNYDQYYERLLKLVKINGLIVFDNTLWHGQVLNEASTDPDTVAIRRLNEKLRDDDRIHLSFLGIGDGVSLALRLH